MVIHNPTSERLGNSYISGTTSISVREAKMNLSAAQLSRIGPVLRLIAEDNDLIHDDAFQTRLGIDRPLAHDIALKWPTIDEFDREDVKLFVSNALNEVVHGVHMDQDHWNMLNLSWEDANALQLSWLEKTYGV